MLETEEESIEDTRLVRSLSGRCVMAMLSQRRVQKEVQHDRTCNPLSREWPGAAAGRFALYYGLFD